MNYYCNICDKIIENKHEKKLFQSLTHNEFKKCIQSKHRIQNPDLFEIDEIINKCITIHNRKIVFYLIKNDFKEVFNEEFHTLVKSDFKKNLTKFLWKKLSLFWIEKFTN